MQKITNIAWIVTFSIFVCGMLFATPVKAHEVRPAIVDVNVDEAGKFELTIQFNMEAWLAGIGADHDDTDQSPHAIKYNKLRTLPSSELSTQFTETSDSFAEQLQLKIGSQMMKLVLLDTFVPKVGDTDLARDSIVRYQGLQASGENLLTWQYDLGPSVLRVDGENNERVSVYVAPGEISEPIDISSPEPRGLWANFVDYVLVGFDHIIPKGLDHILFVVGLFLLSVRLRPLLWQITSFTIAHTVTLGLGILGIITIPANIVEPLIAASIIYVAVENLFMDRLSPWRPVLVFFFGLLHGLGFAGVLKEFGLGAGNFVAGLVGFNVGVELGQLTVILACFLLVGIWFGRKEWYHQRVTIPGSLAIALIASYWFYERVFLV